VSDTPAETPETVKKLDEYHPDIPGEPEYVVVLNNVCCFLYKIEGTDNLRVVKTPEYKGYLKYGFWGEVKNLREAGLIA